jgi:nicotinate-nucleotide pyrophosphorylase (carboxylating)
MNHEPFDWQAEVDNALREDIGTGDLTAPMFAPSKYADWYIESQAEGVLCGVGICEYLFDPESDEEELEVVKNDGARVKPQTTVIRGRTQVSRLLACERTALNFVMHLSGVATLTAKFVTEVTGTRAKIVDTRKTVPGLRSLQKYAVRCGGGFNHRMGLYDAAMLKDNHIRAHGSITKAVAACRKQISHMTKIEVECESREMVAEAVKSGCEVIMLDNMAPDAMRAIVQEFKDTAIFEASGGVTLATVRGVAETGIDIISVGALTHSAPALAFHLELN